ncbi:prepilin peptidase [Pelosinus sp. sgz500959]|uniref:prepilin peptidase n=1 Tax=Pelosinus sp. sgz500959 TaxID=3242472 RepID=UPI00366C236B
MLILLTIIFGLLIGSFLNVCIYRLPKNESIVTPPSHCTVCNTHLKPWDLIPVISYLLSRGRCRYCSTSFSPRYAFVELLTASLFVWCFYVFELSPELIKALILTSFFIVITFIDYDHQLILDKVLACLSIVGVVINLWTHSVEPFNMLIGSLLGGGLLLIIALVSGGGMGGGDIKFAAALGLCFGWEYLILTLFLSFIFGGIGGVLLLVFKMKSRKDFIPFGPFIALAALFTLLYGNNMITWYMEIIS